MSAGAVSTSARPPVVSAANWAPKSVRIVKSEAGLENLVMPIVEED